MPERRPHIGVATCALAPDLDEDGPLLLDALDAAGADPSVVLWDDDTVDWSCFDAVLVRSTWDYPLRRTEFQLEATDCFLFLSFASPAARARLVEHVLRPPLRPAR